MLWDVVEEAMHPNEVDECFKILVRLSNNSNVNKSGLVAQIVNVDELSSKLSVCLYSTSGKTTRNVNEMLIKERLVEVDQKVKIDGRLPWEFDPETWTARAQETDAYCAPSPFVVVNTEKVYGVMESAEDEQPCERFVDVTNERVHASEIKVNEWMNRYQQLEQIPPAIGDYSVDESRFSVRHKQLDQML